MATVLLGQIGAVVQMMGVAAGAYLWVCDFSVVTTALEHRWDHPTYS